jgi:hypothetical protein
MTNAELEVIEVAFTRPLKQTATRIPGISSVKVPISPDFLSSIAGRALSHFVTAVLKIQIW